MSGWQSGENLSTKHISVLIEVLVLLSVIYSLLNSCSFKYCGRVCCDMKLIILKPISQVQVFFNILGVVMKELTRLVANFKVKALKE